MVHYYSELENFTNAIVSRRCHLNSSSSCCIIIDMYKVSFLHVVIHNLIICWENVRVIKKLLDNTSFRTSKKVWRRIHISLAPLFLSICLRILRVFVLKYFVYLSEILRRICIKYPLVTGAFDKCGGELHITFFVLVYWSQSISLGRIYCICFIFLG